MSAGVKKEKKKKNQKKHVVVIKPEIGYFKYYSMTFIKASD